MVNVNPSWGAGGLPASNRRLQPGCLLLRPLRWIAALVITAGIVVIAVTLPWGSLLTIVRGSADAVGDVEPGAIEEIDLPEAGEWVLYAEGDVTVDDCGEDICRGDFIEPDVVVVDEDGAELALSDSNLSVSDVGTESVSLWSFETDAPTTVTVAVGAETDIDRIAVARGPDLELDDFRGAMIGGVIVLVGVGFRIVLGVVGAFFRR